MSKIGLIAEQPSAKCELCGAVEELRPYGPKGENICFDCGMKDEETAEHQMSKHVFGEPIN